MPAVATVIHSTMMRRRATGPMEPCRDVNSSALPDKHDTSRTNSDGIPAVADVQFGTRRIGPGHPTIVIAEIGINHEGRPEVCARMIEEAASAHADAIKLQTIDADENYVPGTESHTMFLDASLDREQTAAMFVLARSLGMEPLTTAADFATVDWVDALAPAAHKVSSGMLTNSPIVRHIARTGRTMLMSTGMADMEDIDRAVAAARVGGTESLALLQCTSLYPCDVAQVNLATIAWLQRRYVVPVGLSDHTTGTDAAAFAVAAGAHVIEKHFTLDSSRLGYDHRLSLDPPAFAVMVRKVRLAETMLGSPVKHLSQSEKLAAERNHRVLVARRAIVRGEVFDRANVALRRPLPNTRGLPPWRYDDILGLRAVRDLEVNEPIDDDSVEIGPCLL